MSYKFCGCLLAGTRWNCTVLDSWWWTEKTPEKCKVLFQNKINLRYCASGWFYYRNILRCTVLQTSKMIKLIVVFRNFDKAPKNALKKSTHHVTECTICSFVTFRKITILLSNTASKGTLCTAKSTSGFRNINITKYLGYTSDQPIKTNYIKSEMN